MCCRSVNEIKFDLIEKARTINKVFIYFFSVATVIFFKKMTLNQPLTADPHAEKCGMLIINRLTGACGLSPFKRN